MCMCRHVVLGFSGCGHYIISYRCEVSLAPPTTFYRYSLHWWKFDLYKKLHQVCALYQFPPLPSPGLPDILQLPSQVASYDLFRDEAIHCELHLIVCQSIDQQHVIIIGCRYVHVVLHACMCPFKCTSSLLFHVHVHVEDLAIMMMNIERVM